MTPNGVSQTSEEETKYHNRQHQSDWKKIQNSQPIDSDTTAFDSNHEHEVNAHETNIKQGTKKETSLKFL
jgi:hypothetical protein